MLTCSRRRDRGGTLEPALNDSLLGRPRRRHVRGVRRVGPCDRDAAIGLAAGWQIWAFFCYRVEDFNENSATHLMGAEGGRGGGGGRRGVKWEGGPRRSRW